MRGPPQTAPGSSSPVSFSGEAKWLVPSVIAHEDSDRAGDVGVKNRKQIALGNLLVELKRSRGLAETESLEEWILKLRLVLQKRSAIVEGRFHGSGSENTWDPALYARAILAVAIPEKSAEARLVVARAPVEPRGVEHEHHRGKPRVERESEPREKDQVPEVHRVAAVAIRSRGDEPLRRNRQSRPAAAFAQPIVTDEAVLQVSPGEQRQAPDLDPRNALLQRRLGAVEQDGPENEGAVRGAAKPSHRRAAGPDHSFAASVPGMNRMKRLAATIVPARKWKVALRPKLSATSPPRSGPIEEPTACAPKRTPMLVPPMFLGVVSRSHACSTGRIA